MTQRAIPVVARSALWLSIVSQLFSNRLSTLLKPHGLTVGQFGILNHIVRQGSAGAERVSDIAAAVEVNQPAVTKALFKFQAMGLVHFVDNQNDRRSKSVVPNLKASELLSLIYQDLKPDLSEAFGAIGDEDIEQFAEMLERFGKWLDKNRLPL